MSTTLVSVLVAGLAAFLIPTLVTAATRRNDRRRRASGETLPNEEGALVTVRLRRWQWVVWRVLGIAFIVVGGLVALSSLAVDADESPAGPLIAGILILFAGVGGLLLASSMRRTRLLGLPDEVRFRLGFRDERVVPLTDIASITPLANQYGGLQAKDARGKRLFYTTGLARGYAEFEAYIAERVAGPQLRAPATPGPDGRSVPSWTGTGVTADWTLLPLGPRSTPRPVVRLTAAGHVAVMHVADIQRLARGEIGAAESNNTPLAFLCWPPSAAPSSLAAQAVAGLPADSLALLVEPSTAATAVIRDAELQTFRSWAGMLPS